MIFLFSDLDLIAVLLHAFVLAGEALLVGGCLYFLLAQKLLVAPAARRAVLRGLRASAWAFIVGQFLYAVIDLTLLIGAGIPAVSALNANFVHAGFVGVVGAAVLLVLLRAKTISAEGNASAWGMLVSAAIVMLSTVWLSHSFSRIEDRWLLVFFTVLHHLCSAAWIGAMPYLLVAVRSSGVDEARVMVRRYSRMALCAAAGLVAAGIGLSYFYVGSWPALYGTAYGVMIVSKTLLMLVVMLLGAGNYFLGRGLRQSPVATLQRIGKLAEVEIGIGFTIILAAASLTSQPPAVDLTEGRATAHDLVLRFQVEKPRLHSPAFSALKPPATTSVAEAQRAAQFRGTSSDDVLDKEWSEYNHNWAGLVVLVAGLMALLYRTGRARWAGNWPLIWIALAIFILLRADPENWPLGPRSFWASFSSSDVLQHRLYAVLIVAMAVFEWGAVRGRWRWKGAPYVFPVLCAFGGALLLTHNHGLGNVKEELLAEISHTAIAVLGGLAGWARWLELRDKGQREAAVAGWVWPLCLAAVGLVLLDYREIDKAGSSIAQLLLGLTNNARG